jgi:hypothetical protein
MATQASVVAAVVVVVGLLFSACATASFSPHDNVNRRFGNGTGFVTIAWPGGRAAAYGVVNSDGKLYLAGPATNPGTGLDFGLVCLDEDTGEPCISFGDADGKVSVDFGNVNGSRTDVATCLVVQPQDGKIIVGGTANLGASAQNPNITAAFSRHDGTTGALDVGAFGVGRDGAFNGAGTVVLDVAPSGVNDEPFSGAVVSNGYGSVWTGFANPGQQTGAGPAFDTGTVQLRTDGTPDPQFGGLQGSLSGRQIAGAGPGFDDRSRALVIGEQDGDLYVIGRSRAPSMPSGVFFGTVIRHTKSGALRAGYGAVSETHFNGTLIGKGVAMVAPRFTPTGSVSTILQAGVFVGRDDAQRRGLGHRNCDLIVAGHTTAWNVSQTTTTQAMAFFVACLDRTGALVPRWGQYDGYSIFKSRNGISDTVEGVAYSKSANAVYLLGRSTRSVVVNNATVTVSDFASVCVNDGTGEPCRGGPDSPRPNRDGFTIHTFDNVISGYWRAGVVSDDRTLYAVGEAVVGTNPAAPARFIAAALRV